MSGDGPLLRATARPRRTPGSRRPPTSPASAPTRIRWIPPTRDAPHGRRRARRTRSTADRAAGDVPFLVVGTAGSVSTGAVDPLREHRGVCREERTLVPRRRRLRRARRGAARGARRSARRWPTPIRWRSIRTSGSTRRSRPAARWCATRRTARRVRATTRRTTTSSDGRPPPNFFDYGPQNSRGFRALKVWLALRQVGRAGYRDDDRATTCACRGELVRRWRQRHPELEAVTQELSITTFRYVPADASHAARARPRSSEHLDALNQRAARPRCSGAARRSSRTPCVDGRYVLRACIVNFRTDRPDLEALIEAVVDIGRELASAR